MAQSDPQRVLYIGSHHVLSPYPVQTQQTKVGGARACRAKHAMLGWPAVPAGSMPVMRWSMRGEDVLHARPTQPSCPAADRLLCSSSNVLASQLPLCYQLLPASTDSSVVHAIGPADSSTQVRLASTKLLSSNEQQPAKRQGRLLTLGPYDATPPWIAQPLRLHYENSGPWLRATRVVREIEVSHWGNIYVEEKYWLR